MQPAAIALRLVDLDDAAVATDEDLAALADAERDSAMKLRSESARRRSLRARAVVRKHLAGPCGCSPREIVFQGLIAGKPIVSQTAAAGSLQSAVELSVSQADGLLLVGIARGAAIGVDLERIDPAVDFEDVAECLFTPTEQAWVDRHPPPLRADAFFRCWAGKEALARATRIGLASNPQAVEFAVVRDGRVEIAPTRLHTNEPVVWTRHAGETEVELIIAGQSASAGSRELVPAIAGEPLRENALWEQIVKRPPHRFALAVCLHFA